MKRKSLIILFFSITTILYSQTSKKTGISRAHLQEFQKNLIINGETGGNVIVVSKSGKVVYHHIENSNKTGDKTITDQTLFPIWSMTKPVTTIAALILKEKNLLDFNDPVSKYIPALKNLMCKSKAGIIPCKNEMKIIDLITHLSGLSYYKDFMLDGMRAKSLEDLMGDIVDHPLEFEPGERYFYGLGHDVLGRVIEVVSGVSLQAFMRTYIFEPLEMNSTTVSYTHLTLPTNREV